MRSSPPCQRPRPRAVCPPSVANGGGLFSRADHLPCSDRGGSLSALSDRAPPGGQPLDLLAVCLTGTRLPRSLAEWTTASRGLDKWYTCAPGSVTRLLSPQPAVQVPAPVPSVTQGRGSREGHVCDFPESFSPRRPVALAYLSGQTSAERPICPGSSFHFLKSPGSNEACCVCSSF